MFPGASIKIVNATRTTSGGVLNSEPSYLTFIVNHDDPMEARVEDNENIAINSMASAIPFNRTTNGNLSYYTSSGYFENLPARNYYDENAGRYVGYSTIELVSTMNFYHNYTNPQYYVWMVVDATLL